MNRICEVVMANQYVTVVRFENKYVQLPSICSNAKKIPVLFSDGKYSIAVDQHEDNISPLPSCSDDSIACVDGTHESSTKQTKRKKVKKATVENDLSIENECKEDIPN